MNGAANRRGYLRYDDDVLLRLQRLDDAAVEAAQAQPSRWRASVASAGSALVPDRRRMVGALATLRARQPEVAAYLAYLERRIEALSSELARARPLENAPTPRRINLSATGLRTENLEGLQAGDAVEVTLVLLPSCDEVAAVGRVVRIGEARARASDRAAAATGSGSSAHGNAQGQVSVHFELILEHDRERLIAHAHRLQRDQLALRQNAA